MLILLFFFTTFIVGLMMLRSNNYSIEDAGLFVAIISAFILLMMLLTIPTYRYGVHSEIAAFQVTQQTLTDARQRGDGIEGAASRLDILEMNRWLARGQYWNGTVFDIWIPDDVMDLEPLE